MGQGKWRTISALPRYVHGILKVALAVKKLPLPLQKIVKYLGLSKAKKSITFEP